MECFIHLFFISSNSWQYIHKIITHCSIIKFIVTFYVENDSFKRKELWHSICNLATNINELWLILGNFSYIRKVEEKIGGFFPISCKLIDFSSCIFNSSLLELPNTSLSFSWFNQQLDNPIICLFNMTFCNCHWINSFPFSHFKVIELLTSTHSYSYLLLAMLSSLSANSCIKIIRVVVLTFST